MSVIGALAVTPVMNPLFAGLVAVPLEFSNAVKAYGPGLMNTRLSFIFAIVTPLSYDRRADANTMVCDERWAEGDWGYAPLDVSMAFPYTKPMFPVSVGSKYTKRILSWLAERVGAVLLLYVAY